jgi:glycerol-3-phosphate acyltransferase PlsX
MVSSALKEGFKSSLLSKLGYLLARSSLQSTLKNLDPKNYNGAMLVGLNGVVVKSHGSADEISFANAIKVTISLIEDKINETIIREIKSSTNILEHEDENL